MTNDIQISEDAFATLFQPQANHLNAHASYDWGQGYGTLYETWGEELAYLQSQPPAHIWTLITGDGCDYVISGAHFVNRLGYFITETPVPDGVTIHVPVASVADHEEPERVPVSISPTVIGCIGSLVDYLWNDEQRHFHEEYGESPGPREVPHIFDSLQLVRNWLNEDHQ